MAEPKRHRSQLVIHLGEGVAGAEARKALEKAASLAHQALSTWSRRVLLAAAGMQDQQFATRPELGELAARVERLELADAPSRADMEVLIQRLEAVEDKLGVDPFPVLDPGERSRRDRSRRT